MPGICQYVSQEFSMQRMLGSQSKLKKCENLQIYLGTIFSYLHISAFLPFTHRMFCNICVRPTNETRKTHNKVVGLWRPIFSFFVVSFFTQ